MAIIQTIDNKYDLQREFKEYDRDYYSLEAYEAMIDLFESMGDNWELDVIALCCDFTEADIDDIRSDYDLSIEEYPDSEDILNYLNYRTYAVELDNGNIFYQAF
jgi:hypothetical protein